MKILLTAINAKYIHSNLAVYSLKRYARGLDADVVIANFTINNNKEDIISGIYKEKPDVVAFSVYIWNVDYVKAVARELKKILPNVKIWLGGPEVSHNPQDFLNENSWADIVLVFEGEATFKELAQGEKSLSDIAGIVYRENGNVFRTGQRALLDMNEIPFPYDDLQEFENRIIYYESSRGCPFACSYCLSSIEKSVRFRDVETVKKELLFFINAKVPQVKFVDRTFNCNHKRTKEIWRFLMENDNGITNFHFEVSADLLDDEELDIISKMCPGLIQLEIGVQSTYQPTIKEIRRSMNLNRLNDVVERINAFGNVHQHLDLIAGLPYEDYETFKQSFNDVYAMKPHQLQLGFLKVLTGSYMHEMAEEYEICYTEFPPYEVLKTKWLSYEEVLELKKIEDMVENYYNSGQFNYTMKYLRTLFDTPFALYEGLAKYYGKNNLWGLNHSRIMRYNYLYEFALESGADERIVAGLITYDLYLREKLKTRPAFALPQSEYKEKIKELYAGAFSEYKDKFSHIEPVQVDTENFTLLSETRFVLFDYEHRDRLNNYAKVMIFDEEREG